MSWAIPMRAVLIVGTTIFVGQADAETRTVQGRTLALALAQSGDAVIDTDPTLADAVRITADGSLACLAVSGGRAAVVGTTGCAGDDLGTLHIAVAPHMPVALSASGGGSIQIDDIHASLTVSLGGGTELKAGNLGSFAMSLRGGGDVTIASVAGPASLQITGGGDVKLGTLNGPLSLKRTGSGDLAIGTISASSVTIDSTGSGDTQIGGGSIGALQVNLRGSGDLAVSATVASGQVAASGGSDIKLAMVTGPLTRLASSGSDITVGDSTASSNLTQAAGQLAEGARQEADRARQAGERIRQQADGERQERGVTVAQDHTSLHLIMAAGGAALLYVAWRILRRPGRLADWRRQGDPRQPAAPVHPGVLAVSESMTRLEQRLGRIEGYVTTREFDLNRKFRDLK